jgi:hypothetical protein
MCVVWLLAWSDNAHHSVEKNSLSDLSIGGNDPELIAQYFANSLYMTNKVSNDNLE